MQKLRIPALILLEAALLAYLIANSHLIWTDEVIQFALGAYPSFGEAARIVFRSIRDVNHGQTGTHMLLNYVMLRAFGASYWVLRAPSYFAYLLGLTAGFFYLEEIGASVLICFLFVIGLGLSQLSLAHGWEARPYIILQGSLLAFLWAWRRFARVPRGRLAALVAAVALGILFHPFFVAYVGMAVAGDLLFDRESRRTLLARASVAPIPMVAAAAGSAALFLLVGSLGWFHSLGVDHAFDPYQYIGHGKSLMRFMLGTFYYPASLFAIPLLALLAAGLVWFRRDGRVAPLVPPFLSLFLNLAVTQFVVGYSVLKSHYWLLQRQWIGGNALAFLLAAILLEFFFRKVRLPERAGAWLAASVPALVVLAALALAIAAARSVTHFDPPASLGETDAFRARLAAQKDLSMGDYEHLARQNLVVGGPVWPEFRRYYDGLYPPVASH
jgi:hypothetical protein